MPTDGTCDTRRHRLFRTDPGTILLYFLNKLSRVSYSSYKLLLHFIVCSAGKVAFSLSAGCDGSATQGICFAFFAMWGTWMLFHPMK